MHHPCLSRILKRNHQLPTALVLAGLGLVAAALSASAAGHRLSIAALLFGEDTVAMVWAADHDGAAPTRMLGVATLLAFWRLAQRAQVELLHPPAARPRTVSSSLSSSSSSSPPPASLVTTGLYSSTRQPYYLALLGGVLAVALVLDSLWVALWGAVPLAWYVVRTAVPEEEALLAGRWPGEYARYCAATPRWLPRLLRPRFWHHTSAVRVLTPAQKKQIFKEDHDDLKVS
jgi:protein-S-isoprenylcysteine O-methyltransferase Ste14